MTEEFNQKVVSVVGFGQDIGPIFDILRQIEDLNLGLQREFENEVKLILDKSFADK